MRSAGFLFVGVKRRNYKKVGFFSRFLWFFGF